ncbi:MAG: hypothetical protein A2Z14_00190 [Chloroflexi bacterium RBG_16_48_8]|nr:MAG: hypothetical protein A2Z14_00190 [Chloroflexi bacterium RBG_16_48_8]
MISYVYMRWMDFVRGCLLALVMSRKSLGTVPGPKPLTLILVIHDATLLGTKTYLSINWIGMKLNCHFA